jgi:metallo-beta-lactamase family protein
VLERLETVAFGQLFDLGNVGTVTFVPAGHIIGAAIVDLQLGHGSDQRRLVFSGDLGLHNARLPGPPKTIPSPDYLIMESTYGDRSRADDGDRTERLFDIVDRTIRRRGKVIIRRLQSAEPRNYWHGSTIWSKAAG